MGIVDLSAFHDGRSGRSAHLGNATREATLSTRQLREGLQAVFEAKAAELRRREEDRRNERQRQRDLRSEFGRTLDRAFANARAAGQITVSALADDAPSEADGDTPSEADGDTPPAAAGPVTVDPDRPITNADLARALETWNANRNRNTGGAK